MKVKWGGGMWEAKNDNQKEQKVKVLLQKVVSSQAKKKGKEEKKYIFYEINNKLSSNCE